MKEERKNFRELEEFKVWEIANRKGRNRKIGLEVRPNRKMRERIK